MSILLLSLQIISDVLYMIVRIITLNSLQIISIYKVLKKLLTIITFPMLVHGSNILPEALLLH